MRGRHALPWTVWAIFRDQSERRYAGKHERWVSPTHRDAWPFNKKETK